MPSWLIRQSEKKSGVRWRNCLNQINKRVADFADALLKSQTVKGISGKEFVAWAKSFPPENAAELSAILKEEDDRQWAMIRWAQENGS